MCSALPAFHPVRGCDYTSTFIRKAKVRPYELMSKIPAVQNASAQIAREETTKVTTITLQNFTTSIYGTKDGTNLNKHRH